MRTRLTLAVALLLAAGRPAAAQWPSTQAMETLKAMFTVGGNFGFPPYAADPFTCDATTRRTTYYNTTTNTARFCNGTAWGVAGGADVGTPNTWTASQTFSSGANLILNGAGTVQIQLTGRAFIGTQTANEWVFGHSTAATPDGLYTGVGALSVSHVFGRRADFDFDFNNGPCGGAACTNPQLIIEPSAQSTTQYGARMSAGAEFRQSKALTEGAATTFVQVNVANLQAGATGGTIDYTISASDGTDTHSRHGRSIFQAVGKAGTVTCTIVPTTEATDGSTIARSEGASTLTYTLTCAVGASLINVQANATSSYAQTSLNIDYAVTLTGAGEIKPQ